MGSVTYSPDIARVPMLGGAGLVILSALLGLVSLRFLKYRGRNGSTVVVLATLTGALAAVGGGIKLISEAQAASEVLLTNNAGGTVILPVQGFNHVINSSSVRQQIDRISADAPCFVTDNILNGGGVANGGSDGGNGGGLQGANSGSFPGWCDDAGGDGTVLQPNDHCDVFVCCPTNGGGNPGGGCFLPI